MENKAYEQEIPYPYWNKDAIPYVVELSAWNEFVVEDLLQDNNE